MTFKFNEKFMRFAVALIFAASLSVFTTGCSDDDNNDDSSGSQSVTNPTALTASCTDISTSDYDLDGDGTDETGVYVLSAPLSGCVNIPADTDVWIDGIVTFREGTALKVNEGVTFYGNPTRLSYLIIDRGAAIVAEGTAAKPITFTSGNKEGTIFSAAASQSDWGGLIINGYARINQGNGEALGEGNSGAYGGTVDADNSGTLKYVRVMFAGKDFSADNELNGIALQGVGSGTTVDYVQVHNNKDDGIEMFGGAVNLKHIVATGNGDDQIDCTFGWRGKVQFAIAASIGGDNGLEHDNNEGTPDATPYTNVTYYNLTVYTDSGEGIHFRHGLMTGNVYNSYVYADAGTCIEQDDYAYMNLYSVVGEGNNASGCVVDIEAGADYTSETRYTADSNVNINTTQVAPGSAAIDWTAVADLATLEATGGSAFQPSTAITGTTASISDDGFFDTTATFIGAVSTTDNWLATWTIFPAN